jgi:hypothetical protein
MALDNAANFVRVVVSTGYNSAATSIVLNGSYTTPTAPFNMTWWDVTDYPDPSNDPNVEIVRVTTATTVSGTTTLTVTRAQESTSATNKNLSSKTYNMLAGLTAKVINTDIPSAINTATSIGVVGTYGTNVTAGNGMPFIHGALDITTGTANGTGTLISAASSLFGVYRVSCIQELLTPATTSATTPANTITWRDGDSGVTTTNTLFGTSTTNTTSNIQFGSALIYNFGFTTDAITYNQVGYASSGTTTMTFAYHYRVEFLG